MRALLGVELPGYRTVDTDTWLNDHGDVLSLHCFDLPPDLPAALEDGPSLRHRLTHFTAQAACPSTRRTTPSGTRSSPTTRSPGSAGRSTCSRRP